MRGQDVPELAEPQAPRWTFRAGLEALYDTNVFDLSEDSLDLMSQHRASDQISGRFDDMNSADDTILTTEVGLQRTDAGWGGNDLHIEPRIRYLRYSQNPKMSHAEFFLDMRQELQGANALELDLRYKNDVFTENYLADAVDLTGSVSSSERRYEPGVYDEWSMALSYERRLWSRSRDSWAIWRASGIRRLNMDATLGAGHRKYQLPFSNRDRDRLSARMRLEVELGKQWRIAGGYTFDRDRTNDDREVVIRDEDDFDIDFNGDGDRVDQNVRAFEKVDRSRNQQIFDLRLTWDFAKHWSASIKGAYQLQDYLSNEPVDTTYRDRVDRERSFRVDLDWEFIENWTASVFAGASREKSNRSEDPGADGQSIDYNDRFIGIGVMARF
jgi:hypothetical protein